jgi:hypothetical protein
MACAGLQRNAGQPGMRETSPTDFGSHNPRKGVQHPEYFQCAHAGGNAAARSPLLGLAVVSTSLACTIACCLTRQAQQSNT